MLLNANNSQLVLVDYQARLMPVIFENELVIANAVRLARMAGLLKVPVWGTEQNPDKLGLNLPELQAAIEFAGGRTLAKMHFSAVADGLVDWLRPPARQTSAGAAALNRPELQKTSKAPAACRSTIVMAGCEAHVCLLQTALELLEVEEYDVWVVTDASSSRTQRNRDAAFDRLARAGAALVTTEMVAFEWARSCEHPAFRDLLRLVK
ncbi:isochorismatase family protein [Roseateles sp. GG27B]